MAELHSHSFTSPSRRGTSKIYRDLAHCLLTPKTSNGSLFSMYTKSSPGSASNFPYALNPFNPPRICVIGAGVSGLRCADILLQNGFDVTILEARNRVGGRVHQIELPNGRMFDSGANWIHGTDNNPINTLAKKTNTTTHAYTEEPHIIDERGHAVENASVLAGRFWKILEQAFKHSAQNSDSIDSEESLLDFFKAQGNQQFPSPEEAEQRKMLMQAAECWGAFIGSQTSRQSLKFYWLEECIDGENLFCAGTYEKIMKEIARPVYEGAHLKLSTKVTHIQNHDTAVRVITASGESLIFDEVVVTCPLGWLKHNKETFEPPLPERLCRAIDSISYGTLEKVIISFPEAFWLGDASKPDNNSFKAFAQWLHPTYAQDTNPHQWTFEAVELSTLPDDCAQPTLLFYLWGDTSVYIATKLSEMATEQEREAFLVSQFKPYYSRLPHYNEVSTKCQPTGLTGTTWLLDEFAGYGSYSNFQVGLTEGDKDIETMREGLPERHIWFAGEHTAPFVAAATVTGAYWSGETVGRRIAGAYGVKVDSETRNSTEEMLDSIVHGDHPMAVSTRARAMSNASLGEMKEK